MTTAREATVVAEGFTYTEGPRWHDGKLYFVDFYTYSDPCRECEDPCGECPNGTCAPPAPFGWDGPVLVWKGANGEAPECPEEAPVTRYEGYAGLNTFSACGPCECSPATCELPGGIEVSTTDGTCGGSLQSVDVPAGWDGSCLAIDPVDLPTSIPGGAHAARGVRAGGDPGSQGGVHLEPHGEGVRFAGAGGALRRQEDGLRARKPRAQGRLRDVHPDGGRRGAVPGRVSGPHGVLQRGGRFDAVHGVHLPERAGECV